MASRLSCQLASRGATCASTRWSTSAATRDQSASLTLLCAVQPEFLTVATPAAPRCTTPFARCCTTRLQRRQLPTGDTVPTTTTSTSRTPTATAARVAPHRTPQMPRPPSSQSHHRCLPLLRHLLPTCLRVTTFKDTSITTGQACRGPRSTQQRSSQLGVQATILKTRAASRASTAPDARDSSLLTLATEREGCLLPTAVGT